ncbi:MAG: CpaF family protein [Actinobacteria bacterium]|jgi:pilus assembly protein CpaF|nr:CpaF family protein [Actinomycetota bacterium]
MDAGATVEGRVRDEVRARGIDPQRDPESVRHLVDEAILESLTHGPLDDVATLGTTVFHAVAGFGLLQPYFDDPLVEELWINEPGRVFVAREGRSELTTVVLNEGQVRDLVERMLRRSGRRLDLSSPFVDAMLPDGSRLHVAIPDITREHWAVNVRRFVVRARTLDDLVGRGTLTATAAAFLDAAVISGLNVVVAGGTQSGKTTFVNALLGCVPAMERIVTCEEVFEISLHHPDWVALQTRDASLEGTGAVPLRRLVREALRMRPTRLVVGEVRQAEALDLLVAMNSGMPSMATLHANSAREAVTKLCTLPLLAGQNIAADFVVPAVAGCVDLVVHLVNERSGVRRVREICALPGRVDSGVVEMADVYVDRGHGLERGRGFPPHEERFRQNGFDLAELLGAEDGSGWSR